MFSISAFPNCAATVLRPTESASFCLVELFFEAGDLVGQNLRLGLESLDIPVQFDASGLANLDPRRLFKSSSWAFTAADSCWLRAMFGCFSPFSVAWLWYRSMAFIIETRAFRSR